MSRMKLSLILVLALLVSVTSMGQQIGNHGVSAQVGIGSIDGYSSLYSYSVGYSKHIAKGMYATFSYSEYNGSNSFEDELGFSPSLNEFGDLGNHIRFANEYGALGKASRIHVDVYAVGVKKYIQLAPKFYFSGNISILLASQKRQLLKGVEFDNNNELLLDQLYPQFDQLLDFGGRVDIIVHYFLADYVSFDFGGAYSFNPDLFEGKLSCSVYF